MDPISFALTNRFTRWLLPDHLFPGDPDSLRRARFLGLFVVFAASLSPPLVVLQLMFGAPFLAWTAGGFGIAIASMLPLLRWRRSVWLGANGVTAIMAMEIALVSLSRGGYGRPILMVFAVLPIFGLFAGRRSGFFWLLATLVLMTGIALLQIFYGPLPRILLGDTVGGTWPNHMIFVIAIYLLMLVNVYLRQRALEDRRATEERLRVAEQLRTESETEAKLLRSERMAELGTLSAGVAHEINNPLTYILANVSYLNDSIDNLDEDVRLALADVEDGAMKIARIVRDISTFSRVERHNLVVSFDVHEVLDTSINLLDNQIRHCATLTKRYATDLPLAFGSKSRLGQVFVNLLSNAVHVVSEDQSPGEIEVLTEFDAEQELITVAVRDNGEGIPAEIKARVFEPFFTTKPVGVGTGLGLSICHGIVAEHGGEMRIESSSGAGTTVFVDLPQGEAGQQATMEVKPASRSRTSGPMRILVIDDDPSVGSAIVKLLPEHQTVVTGSGHEAIALLSHDTAFDAVLCDVMMPRLSGEEVYRTLRDRHPEIARRVVFITGGAFSDGARAFLERVAQPVIEKPLKGDLLHDVLQLVVEAEAEAEAR